jgi:hypothetical protein
MIMLETVKLAVESFAIVTQHYNDFLYDQQCSRSVEGVFFPRQMNQQQT